MTQIIETLEDFEKFKLRFKEEDSILLGLFSDVKKHPAVNSLSLLWAHFIKANENVIISVNHNDCLPIPESEIVKLTSGPSTVYTLGKKALLHKFSDIDFQDLELLQYLDTNQPLSLEETIQPTTRQTFNQFLKYRNVNQAVPLMTLIEQFKAQTTVCKSILEKRFIGLNSQSYLFFNEVATNSLNWIEKSGLYVNPGGFLNVLGDKSKGLIHEGYVYSDYNLLTSTGRCSNRFGGINFAALPKKDGIREYFISRFGKDGELISVDYESFHLRLIAEMIVFDLPYLEPVHQYLGKQYFKTDTLTPEQYEAGKGITFQYLYGTYKPPEMKEIPYFVEVEKFTKALWKEMEIEGFVESPIFKKKIYLHHISDPNPSKVFNYLVQLFETEKNLFTLHKVGNEMRANKMESKIILYTYDAILIDAKISEMGQLSKVIGTLEHGGQYPVRVYRGENYQNLSLDEGKLRNI